MRSIIFEKKKLGQWCRDDGELKKDVNEEAMFREIAKLSNDGWLVELGQWRRDNDRTHIRNVKVYKS